VGSSWRRPGRRLRTTPRPAGSPSSSSRPAPSAPATTAARPAACSGSRRWRPGDRRPPPLTSAPAPASWPSPPPGSASPVSWPSTPTPTRSPPPPATPPSTPWPTASPAASRRPRRWRRSRPGSSWPTSWPPPTWRSRPATRGGWRPGASWCWAASSTPRRPRWRPPWPPPVWSRGAARPSRAGRRWSCAVPVCRFTIAPEHVAGDRVVFDRDETRHITTVLRLGPGDLVVAADGRGRDYTVRIERLGPGVVGTVVAVTDSRAESPLALTLLQGIPKGDRMEAIVRAATELGVVRVLPVIAERTVVRLEAARWHERARRWQRVARE